MSYQTFVKEYRGGIIENIHIGQLSCVNGMKEEIYSLGQNREPVYFRSAAKPFQAIPIFLTACLVNGYPVDNYCELEHPL